MKVIAVTCQYKVNRKLYLLLSSGGNSEVLGHEEFEMVLSFAEIGRIAATTRKFTNNSNV